jgi:general secretion pathway protein H
VIRVAHDAGFTLIEAVAVLAIVGLLAAIALPRWPQGTTRPQLQAFALRAAALLKADRNAAIRERRRVETLLNPATGQVASGAGAGVVQIPADVRFDALVAENCAGRGAGSTIDFLPSGMSCGGTIALTRPGAAYRVRVNWLTGGVEIVESSPAR